MSFAMSTNLWKPNIIITIAICNLEMRQRQFCNKIGFCG